MLLTASDDSSYLVLYPHKILFQLSF